MELCTNLEVPGGTGAQLHTELSLHSSLVLQSNFYPPKISSKLFSNTDTYLKKQTQAQETHREQDLYRMPCHVVCLAPAERWSLICAVRSSLTQTRLSLWGRSASRHFDRWECQESSLRFKENKNTTRTDRKPKPHSHWPPVRGEISQWGTVRWRKKAFECALLGGAEQPSGTSSHCWWPNALVPPPRQAYRALTTINTRLLSLSLSLFFF